MYMCGEWGRLSRLYFQFPKQCWTLLLREFTVFGLDTGYSHSGLFWCAFRLYNQSQNSAQECMMGATCAQLNIRTLLNIQNVPNKTNYFGRHKEFRSSFWRHIHSVGLNAWSSHTVSNVQRMLLAFCISLMFDHCMCK